MTEISQEEPTKKSEKIGTLRRQYEKARGESGQTLLEEGIDPDTKQFRRLRQKFAKKQTVKEIEGEVDVLTGLLNRRGFERRIEDIVGTMKRKGTNVFSLMLDVNDLKKINDEDKTHRKGDELIKKAALCMLNEVRATDIVVRWGGDEFLILLVDTNDMGGVLKFWERLNDSFIKNGVKISVGASQLDPNNIEGSIDNADKRMYLAKAESKEIGRNMITTSN